VLTKSGHSVECDHLIIKSHRGSYDIDITTRAPDCGALQLRVLRKIAD
jgi:hypothetical protein